MPVYEGPTIDDAISKGLQALGVKKEAVDIEILTDAKKGFLGMGKKDARVSIEPINVEEPVIAAETNKKSTEEEQTFAEEKTEEKIQQAVESSSSDIQLIDLLPS